MKAKIINNEFGNGRKNAKLIVVRSNGNTGKTTTIWMVLYALIGIGASVNKFHDYSGRNIPPVSMPSVGPLPDLEADVTWKGKHIILFSYGDTPKIMRNLMTAAISKHPDYIVCASRSQYRTNSVWELFETIYTNLLFERVCFWSEYTTNVANAISVKNPTVEAIVKYIA